MKMESQIHLKLVDAVTKYFEKMLSHRQMMTKHFLKNLRIFGPYSYYIYNPQNVVGIVQLSGDFVPIKRKFVKIEKK